MREIKFRGKDLNKQWVYGVPYTKEIFSTEHKKIIGYKTYIITYLADDLRSIERDEVDPNTVGQFTGLHDKNGVEIYEGDWVMLKGQKCFISFSNTMGAWDVSYPVRDDADFPLENLLYWWYYIVTPDIEVIGNIHEEVVE